MNPPSPGRDQCRNDWDALAEEPAGKRARPRRRVAITEGDFVTVKSIRPEGAEPIPVRGSTHRMGTIIARFVAILALVIVVLMLVWYR
jgi:hypothetical protein